jgi:spermidine synthase
MNVSTTNDSPAEPRSRQFWLVAVCFLISGFAALLYETVWLRQFAILLGTSEQALAVVLASYMGGLAIE